MALSVPKPSACVVFEPGPPINSHTFIDASRTVGPRLHILRPFRDLEAGVSFVAVSLGSQSESDASSEELSSNSSKCLEPETDRMFDWNGRNATDPTASMASMNERRYLVAYHGAHRHERGVSMLELTLLWTDRIFEYHRPGVMHHEPFSCRECHQRTSSPVMSQRPV